MIDWNSGERTVVGCPAEAATGGALRGDDSSVALTGPDGLLTGQESREEQRTGRNRSCGRLPVYFTGYVEEILGNSYGFVKPAGGKITEGPLNPSDLRALIFTILPVRPGLDSLLGVRVLQPVDNFQH